MTRMIKLTSVGTAIDPNNLLTYPITSDGEIITVSSKPFQDYDYLWWSQLSTQDEIVVHMAIERFQAIQLVSKVYGVTESTSFTREMKLSEEISEFLTKIEEQVNDSKRSEQLFNDLDEIFFGEGVKA